MTLLRNICDPYAADARAMLLGSFQNLLPQGLVELLGCISVASDLVKNTACLDKPIGMTTNYRDISRLWIRVVQRDVLLYCEVQDVFLLVRGGSRVFPYMLAWDNMFHDTEELGRHIQGAC